MPMRPVALARGLLALDLLALEARLLLALGLRQPVLDPSFATLAVSDRGAPSWMPTCARVPNRRVQGTVCLAIAQRRARSYARRAFPAVRRCPRRPTERGGGALAQTSAGQTVQVPDAQGPSGLDGFFKITERGSTVRTEILAGLTTWLTMAYILFLNPAILGAIPDNQGTTLTFPQVLTVTALAAGVMTIAMGVVGKYPFAIAAGLGLNAFVAFTLVGQLGLTWPQAMGVIVIEGVVISILVLTGLREMIMDAIPMDLKLAIGIGIGLFLAIIGFVNGGVVVAGQGTVVTINPDLTTLRVLVFLVTLGLTAALVARQRPRGDPDRDRVRHGGRDGRSTSSGAPSASGTASARHRRSSLAHRRRRPTSHWSGTSPSGSSASLGFWTASRRSCSVMLSDFFDTMGTAVGLGGEAGLLDADGRLPGIKRVLLVDCAGRRRRRRRVRVVEHHLHRERVAGIGDGGRTGLTAVVVGVLFLLCDVLLADRGDRAAGGDGAGADHRRLLHDDARRRHRLARPGDRHPGAAHDHADAVHVLDHERRGGGVRVLHADQGAAGEGRATCTR